MVIKSSAVCMPAAHQPWPQSRLQGRCVTALCWGTAFMMHAGRGTDLNETPSPRASSCTGLERRIQGMRTGKHQRHPQASHMYQDGNACICVPVQDHRAHAARGTSHHSERPLHGSSTSAPLSGLAHLYDCCAYLRCALSLLHLPVAKLPGAHAHLLAQWEGRSSSEMSAAAGGQAKPKKTKGQPLNANPKTIIAHRVCTGQRCSA